MAQMQAAGGTVAGKNDVFHGDPSANLRLLYDVRILYHRCADFSNRKIGGCCPGGRVEYCVRLRRPVGSCEAGARFESTRCQKRRTMRNAQLCGVRGNRFPMRQGKGRVGKPWAVSPHDFDQRPRPRFLHSKNRQAPKKSTAKRCFSLVPRRGFEPRTPCLKGRCSTD